MTEWLTTSEMLEELKPGDYAEGSTCLEVRKAKSGRVIEINAGDTLEINPQVMAEKWRINPDKDSLQTPSIIHDLKLTELVTVDVDKELKRQRELYGVQRHTNHKWLPILLEEVGEVAEALQIDTTAAKQTDADDLYKELTQVAAVAISWAAQFKETK